MMRSLRTRLAVGFGGLLAILVVTSVLSIVVLTRYSHALERVFRENYDSAVYCDQMKNSLDALNSRAQEAVWNERSILAEDVEQMDRFQSNLDRQLGNCTLPGELEATGRLATLWNEYRDTYRRFDAAAPSDREGMYRRELLPRYQRLKNLAQHVADMNMSNMVSVDGQARRTLVEVRRSLLILPAIAIVLVSSVLIAVGATILAPLRGLTRSALRIGAGDLDLSMPVRSSDEIGQLTEAFNAMASRLREFRRREEDRLTRTRRSTQLAIDTLPDAVVVVGPGGRVETSNSAARLHFGIVPAALIADLPLNWLREAVEQVSSTGRPLEPRGYDSAIQLFKEGREKFLLPHAVPMLDERGDRIGVTVILVDVTSLRHADEVKSGVVSTVSHELRTPLTALRMALSLLSGRAGDLTPRQRTLVKTAHDESERLYGIIENLLNISRIEAGRTQYELQPVAASEIVDAATGPLKEGFDRKRAILDIRFEPNLPRVMADRVFAGHALNNLLSNALKFSPEAGRVAVTVDRHDSGVAFTVSDNGPGIPEQYVGRLFEKFFRIPRADGPAGVGLGLAITREIVEAHHGAIRFRPCPGGGCEFTFTLPAAENGADSQRSASA